jgi:hypothetical protein
LLLTPKIFYESYFTSPRRHISKNHWIEERRACSAINRILGTRMAV